MKVYKVILDVLFQASLLVTIPFENRDGQLNELIEKVKQIVRKRFNFHFSRNKSSCYLKSDINAYILFYLGSVIMNNLYSLISELKL